MHSSFTFSNLREIVITDARTRINIYIYIRILNINFQCSRICKFHTSSYFIIFFNVSFQMLLLKLFIIQHAFR